MHRTCNLTSARKITKCNVKRAVKLITKHNADKKRRRDAEEARANDRKAQYCKRFEDGGRGRTSLVAFSKSLALSEMQSYIARQDWKSALKLFPRLLEYPIELEPLIWRYAFIILLHTNDPLHLQQFFKQCIGTKSNGILLERLLLLPLEEWSDFQIRLIRIVIFMSSQYVSFFFFYIQKPLYNSFITYFILHISVIVH